MTVSLPAVTAATTAMVTPRRRFLHRLNPLAKIVATVPAVIALVSFADVTRPVLLLTVALALILLGADLTRRRLLLVVLGFPAATLALSFSFGVMISGDQAAGGSPIFTFGAYTFTTMMWLAGLTTALRLTAIVALTLIAGLTMTGQEFVRSLVQQARLPYRIAYAALAAIRFIPRIRVELDTIRAAHRVRGVAAGQGPLAGLRRRLAYTVPLLAGSIRHAERVALAMETRAFGAYGHRTERSSMSFRKRDAAFVLLFWAITTAILLYR